MACAEPRADPRRRPDTSFLFAIILTFMFTVYATSPLIGSPAKMYDMLVEAAERNPVKDNADGSYLTMRSKSGLIFGVINLIGNYGTVFLDQVSVDQGLQNESPKLTEISADLLAARHRFPARLVRQGTFSYS